jgi:hypothetical protein
MPLESLLARYIDDRDALAPEELDELIAGLRAEPERAIKLCEQLQVDELLSQKLAIDRRNFLAQVEQRIADYERGQDEIDAQVADVRAIAESSIHAASPWSGTPAWLMGTIALAAAALIAAVVFVPGLLPVEDQAVAKVVALQGEVQSGTGKDLQSLAMGQTLLTGQELRTAANSNLTLAYPDKTKLNLAGQTRLTLRIDASTGAKRVEIAAGQVAAEVSPQKDTAPMTFYTPHAIATVLGTQLRLTVTDERTLLDVTEGHVELKRLIEGSAVQVRKRETGVATAQSLAKHELRWPAEERQAITFLVDPFLQVKRQFAISRDQASGNFFDTTIEAKGPARINEFTNGLETAGGWFVSSEAGEDLLALNRGMDAFTLEIVFSPAAGSVAQPGRIVALADDGQDADFALTQRGNELELLLRTGTSALDTVGSPKPLTVPVDWSTGSIHLSITWRPGELLAYQDGRLIAQSDQGGSLSAWRAGPLTIGAGADGSARWEGTVEALACYRQFLDRETIARNARSFHVLSGR